MSERTGPDRAPSRREQARLKAAELRAAELARERRRRTTIITGAVVAVLVVVVGIGAVIQSQRGGAATGVVAVPANLVDGGVADGPANAPVTITIYEDFQCPACKSLEATIGSALAQLRDAGKIRVLYEPIAFLDRASTTDYSSRSLNAAACLINEAPQGFQQLHDALFAQQPEEGSAGLTNARLTELVVAAGATKATSCIDGRTYREWVKQVTDQSSRDGITQTPTVSVNGKNLVDLTPAGLQAAVAAAG